MERANRPDREASQLPKLGRSLGQSLTEFRGSARTSIVFETSRRPIVQYRVVIATLVLLLVSSSAFAQEMPTEHKVGLSLYAGAATLDYHSTYQAMRVGIPESNPLGRFTEGKPGATVLVGASIDAVVTPLLYRWLGKKNPKLTTVLLYSVSAFRTHLAIGNYEAAAGRRRMLAIRRPSTGLSITPGESASGF
jgi:hypothetical protein